MHDDYQHESGAEAILRSSNLLREFWPIITTIVVCLVVGGIGYERLDSRQAHTEEAIKSINDKGVPLEMQALATINANQAAMTKSLDRIEGRLGTRPIQESVPNGL